MAWIAASHLYIVAFVQHAPGRLTLSREAKTLYSLRLRVRVVLPNDCKPLALWHAILAGVA